MKIKVIPDYVMRYERTIEIYCFMPKKPSLKADRKLKDIVENQRFYQ